MMAGAWRHRLVARVLPYLLIAPTLVLVLMFNVLPAVNTVNDSLYKPARGLNAAGKPPEFVGTQNFADILDDSHYMGQRFVRTFRNTLIFALATVVLAVPLGLLLALLLNRPQRLLGAWRFFGVLSGAAATHRRRQHLVFHIQRQHRFGERGAAQPGTPGFELAGRPQSGAAFRHHH